MPPTGPHAQPPGAADQGATDQGPTDQGATDQGARTGVPVTVIIPARDEAGSIGAVVADFRAAGAAAGHPTRVIVADNGSRDATAARAGEAGAQVVAVARPGYGSACLGALATDAALQPPGTWIVFVDGDGACDPADLAALLAPLAGGVELVIGVRERSVEPGALTVAQRFGNGLASTILRLGYGSPTRDLGPFRAITRPALERLRMDDPDFGWTVQMQARAATHGLRVAEVPVAWRRRRAGTSKVSGDLRASLAAGRIILTTLWRERPRQRP